MIIINPPRARIGRNSCLHVKVARSIMATTCYSLQNRRPSASGLHAAAGRSRRDAYKLKSSGRSAHTALEAPIRADHAQHQFCCSSTPRAKDGAAKQDLGGWWGTTEALCDDIVSKSRSMIVE